MSVSFLCFFMLKTSLILQNINARQINLSVQMASALTQVLSAMVTKNVLMVPTKFFVNVLPSSLNANPLNNVSMQDRCVMD